MNYINIFQNEQVLSVSAENNYPEDQLMHIFLNNFSEGWKYFSQIASHLVELRIEGEFTDH